MRALVVEELAPNYAGCAIREVTTPQPDPGEALVRVRAASVNFPDLLMTRGEYQLKPPLPFTPGLDLAGEVVALGEGVTGLAVGDAVVGGARLGGFAEYAVLSASALKPKPAQLSFAEAAAYGAAYLTAYVALVRRARLEPGEWVLVHGAAGDPAAPVWNLAPFVDLPGTYGVSTYLFEWEREWRHVGDLPFAETDPAFLIIPETLHDAARAFFASAKLDHVGPSYECPFIDPYWDENKIEAALSG